MYNDKSRTYGSGIKKDKSKDIVMDTATFEIFKEYAVKGERSKVVRLDMLDEEELRIYTFLKQSENRNRLEQEKIPQGYVESVLANIFKTE